ncbi:hypothetical protein AMTRI_Chr08g161280 [Amborella trichopoda]
MRRFPKVSRILLENLLYERFKVPEIWLTGFGSPIRFLNHWIEPLNCLSERSRWVRLVRFPMAGKKFPAKEIGEVLRGGGGRERLSQKGGSQKVSDQRVSSLRVGRKCTGLQPKWHGVSWVSFQKEKTSFGSLVMADLRVRRERPSRFKERGIGV